MPATRKPKSPTPKAAPRKRAKAGALPSPFDPKAAREALGRETKAITRLQKDAARNAWQIGRRLTQVVQLELHGAGGFDSIEAYAEQALGIARTTTFQYMRVSQAFSEEVVATFGLEKLDRALAYIAKTPEDEAPTDIPQLAIRVPSASGGVVEKPFAQVTIPELRRAAQREADQTGKKKRSKKAAALAAQAARVSEANRALDAAVGKADADRASVSLRDDGGDLLVDVRGLPLVHAGKALAALAKALR